MKDHEILTLIKLNRLFPIKWNFIKKIRFGNWRISLEKREKDNLWGRFGGGWNWKLGFQWGKDVFIFYWFVGTLNIRKKSKKED